MGASAHPTTPNRCRNRQRRDRQKHAMKQHHQPFRLQIAGSVSLSGNGTPCAALRKVCVWARLFLPQPCAPSCPARAPRSCGVFLGLPWKWPERCYFCEAFAVPATLSGVADGSGAGCNSELGFWGIGEIRRQSWRCNGCWRCGQRAIILWIGHGCGPRYLRANQAEPPLFRA
jgi:hypothetical protein